MEEVSETLKPQWLPLTAQSMASVVFKPTAIAEYAHAFSMSKKPDYNLAISVRKQLLLLNWKIERQADRKNAFRYRYRSPEGGKVYLSLHLLCNDLVNSSSIGFDNVKIESRKRKNIHNDDDYKEESEGSLASELTELKSEEEALSPNPNPEENLERIPARQRNFGPGILCSLIDNNVVTEGARVSYRVTKTREKKTEGRITRGGIECDCCRTVFALTKFEAHAGSTNHRPAANIVLEDGRSLADCQRQLEGESVNSLPKKSPKNMLKWKLKVTGKQNSEEKMRKKRKIKAKDVEKSDYMCSVCRQEGDLFLCDDCPAAFHKICLGMENVPFGNWSCPFCCCDCCNSRKFKDTFVRKDGSILRCDQCPVKVHVGCAKDRGMDCEGDKNTGWFCSNKCREIFSNVQNLLGQPIIIGDGNLTWTLLRKWPKSAENTKLNLALKVMHECFDPATEFFTGRDLIEDVLFSKKDALHRVNFRRFCTILVEKDGEPVSVANLRISGDRVAEVPLVATRFEYRRLGMCKKLMDELEKQLIKLGVQKLVLPSAPTTLQTWMDGFGFSEMTEADRRQYFNYSFLDFQGTIMCQKLLAKVE
ncbi:Acyl-CoA N-acyltransferase with RING/FYVE/PHD-type zinc finger domain [Euphorbia peplus]|nr:Acyl-CoA N-acyltransferase with RING/FYVE/PHD-type zinc finger domain [Euphorbia peplus]